MPEDKETSKKLFDDAMFKLEHQNKDENVGKKQKERINMILQRNDDVWKDNFSANLALRKIFRVDVHLSMSLKYSIIHSLLVFE